MTKRRNIGRIVSFFVAYFSVAGIAVYGVRQVILNKAMSEFRSGAHLADVLMTDVSYGSLFIKEGISHPFTTPDVKRYVRGSYDENGQWYTMYMLTMALMYNRNMVKPSDVPRSYQD